MVQRGTLVLRLFVGFLIYSSVSLMIFAELCYNRHMKLADYAKQMGVRYETAWRWFRDGKIQGQRIGPHTIIITEGRAPRPKSKPQRVAIYARVSSHEHQPNLDRQAERLVAYCAAKGYQVSKVVKEIGSGVNDSRPKLLGPAGRPEHHAHRGRTQRPRDALWLPLSRHAAARVRDERWKW